MDETLRADLEGAVKHFPWGKAAVSILICELAGVLASVSTSSSVQSWYPSLQKPFFTPAPWLFSPVWIFLYALMGTAFALVWRKGLDTEESFQAASAFGFQLILNVFWSIIFFGLRMPWVAFFEILLLLFTILLTFRLFKRISRTGACLLIPYILWVGFAAVLNLSLAILNT